MLIFGATVMSASVLSSCVTGEKNSTPEVTTLSPEGAKHWGLSVSPDGKHIAYWEPTGEGVSDYQLWMANTDFSSPVKLPLVGINVPVAWSADGTKILATSTDGFGKVVVLPVSGGQPKRVTPGTAYQNHIMFNPDGDRILYIEFMEGGTFGLRVVSLSTGERRDAIPGEKRPFFGSWSPDGKHLGYVIFDGGKSTMWVAEADGTNPRQLTTEGFESVQEPWTDMWSPDSKEILYESTRTGAADLWIAPIDGSKPRQLTHDVRRDYHGSWSSDGQWIAFESDRGHQVDVWTVPSHGGAEIRVTDDAAEEDILFGTPRWIPGTHTLMFASITWARSVWSINSDGTGPQRLTGDSVQPRQLALSPDGRQVAFANQHPGNISDLAVISVTGGSARTLVAGGGLVGDPSWSSDGQQLAFKSDREGRDHFFVVPAAGGTPRRVGNGKGDDASAAWNGKRPSLFLVSNQDARLGDLWEAPVGGGEPTRITHEGTIGALATRRGTDAIVVGRLEQKTAALGMARVTAGGSLTPIYDRSNTFLGPISPKGDSVILSVQQPDGAMRPRIFSLNGGDGRPIGAGQEVFVDWSDDGRFATYTARRNGQSLIGVLNLADGTSKVLTSSKNDEFDPYLTPDGSKIVYRVDNTAVRIKKVDLTKALAAAPK